MPLLMGMGAGPTGPVTREEFVGSYVSTHQLADETLEIFADGTYHHVYHPYEGEGFEETGTWEPIGAGGSGVFTLYDYDMAPRPWSALESRHEIREDIEWACRTERGFSGGTIRLLINPDDGYHYTKQ